VLTIYRRHREGCPHSSRRHKRCQCPIYVEGSLRGEKIKKGLDLTSWEAASDLVAKWSAAGEIGVAKDDPPTVKAAIAQFLQDAEAQHLHWETVRKYRNLLDRRFLLWCESNGYRLLRHIDVTQIRTFRTTWTDGPLYATKNLERLRAFFRFCHTAGWVRSNPASQVKLPQSDDRPTLPFSEEEMKRILGACDKYRGRRARVRAFVLVMRYSGLRIGDTIQLTRQKVKEGKIFIRTQKTGQAVYVPVPPIVTDALEELDSDNYFWTAKGKLRTAVGNWERYLQSLFKLAKIDGAHSHRFRDTFAVSLLEQGVPVETVARLLGHSPRITWKHYAPHVKSLQVALEDAVKKTWGDAPV
jgi:integrase/recombinase XerD